MAEEPFRERVYVGSAADAVLVQLALERQGVPCVLVNPNVRGLLRGEVYVLVQNQVERARMLVGRHLKGSTPSEAALAPSWRCPSCDEVVEGQFQACWNCGTTRR